MKQQRAAVQQKPRRIIGRPFPPGVSGNPEGMRVRGRRFTELYNDIAASFGGLSALSPFQKILLRQGVRLLVKAEKERDPDLAVRLSNACMRALAGMQHGGLNVRKAPPKPPPRTLAEHLAQTSGGAP